MKAKKNWILVIILFALLGCSKKAYSTQEDTNRKNDNQTAISEAKPDVKVEGQEEKISVLIDQLGDKDPMKRSIAMNNLTRIGKPAVSALIKTLKDEKLETRKGAAQALAMIGPDARDAIDVIENILYSDDKLLYLYAAGTLTSIEEPPFSKTVKLLKNDNPVIRRAMVESLPKIGPAAVTYLIDALKDEDSLVRWYACIALKTFGPKAKDAIGPLTLATQDDDNNVRHQAIEALKKINSTGDITDAGSIGTSDSLAEKFISNVNAKNRDGQWELIHPTCIQKMSSLQKEFIDASIARDLRKPIPEKHRVRVTKLGKGALANARGFSFPVEPTHRFDVEFNTDKVLPLESRTAISRFIAKEGGKWFIIVPIMNEEFLKKNRDHFSELYVAGYNMSPEPQIGILENKTNYVKMLADELGITHFNVRMVYDHPVYIAAHFSAEMEGETIKSRTVTLEEPSNIVGIYFVYRTKPLEPQTEKAYHWFNVVLNGFMEKEGVDKETQREYLQEHPKSEHLPGSSKSIKSYLFNSKRPLPVNKRVSYFKLIDEKGRGGKDVTYSRIRDSHLFYD